MSSFRNGYPHVILIVETMALSCIISLLLANTMAPVFSLRGVMTLQGIFLVGGIVGIAFGYFTRMRFRSRAFAVSAPFIFLSAVICGIVLGLACEWSWVVTPTLNVPSLLVPLMFFSGTAMAFSVLMAAYFLGVGIGLVAGMVLEMTFENFSGTPRSSNKRPS